MPNHSVLADPLVLETILVTLARGGTLKQAAELTATSARSIHRRAKTHPEFRKMLDKAQKVGSAPDAPGRLFFRDLIEKSNLSRPEPPLVTDLPPPESALPEPVDLPPPTPPPVRKARQPSEPSPAIEAEIVSTKRTPAEHPETEWSETDQEHLARRGDPSEEAIAEYYWRVMHDRREPVAMRVTAMKALHDHKMAKARATRLEELAGIGRPRVDVQQDRERGIPDETVAAWRHKFIGPPPPSPPKETDD